uniref:SJCHGC02971 protein n=1 Tax=Schistosoma japonicum TaxID=6182 RepID=Q5BT22_SCHJA|nr:SJCHGC02971 protein [Schistosoma japonicum]
MLYSGSFRANAYLVDTEHQADIKKDFKIIYRVPPNLAYGLLIRFLHLAEAVNIHLLKPDLGVNKKYVQPPSLS